jgi:hypothetical protein
VIAGARNGIFDRMATRKLWSAEATASRKRHLHPGVFALPTAVQVAGALFAESHGNYVLAARRLTFFINRAGRNLSATTRKRLEDAKVILHRAELAHAARVITKRVHHHHL